MDLVTINMVFIIVVGLLGFRSRLILAKVDDPVLKLSHYSLAVMCLAWSAFYLFVLLGEFRLLPLDAEFIRNWLVRPLVTVTLGLVTAGSIARRKRNGFQ